MSYLHWMYHDIFPCRTIVAENISNFEYHMWSTDHYFQLKFFKSCCSRLCCFTCILIEEKILWGAWFRMVYHIAKKYVIKNRIIISISIMTNLWFLFSVRSINDFFHSFHITLRSVYTVIVFLLLKLSVFDWVFFGIIIPIINFSSAWTISNIKMSYCGP